MFLIQLATAQEYEYFGAVFLNGNKETSITYKLAFDVDSEGKISGYSISDINGPHETKNAVVGHYDFKTRKLSFFEKDIIYTKSSITQSSFCYINFTGIVKVQSSKSKIKGDFKGWYKNKKECIGGKIAMAGSHLLDKWIKKVNRKIQKSTEISQEEKETYNVERLFDSLQNQQLVTKENINILSTSKDIQFTIWDIGEPDGDRINIYHNDELILENFEVSKEKYILNRNISGEKNVFTIKAINEGRLKPNTAMMILEMGDKKIDFMSNLKINEQSTVTIIKE